MAAEEKSRRDKIAELIQEIINADDAAGGEEGNLVMEWVIAVSVAGIHDDGSVYTSYRRLVPNGGLPPHHVDGLLEVVTGLDYTD